MFKKTELFFTIFLLLFSVSMSYGAVEVTVFDEVFVRDKGKPVTETINFIGLEGPATIRLINGGGDNSSGKKISSAIIGINGTDIFSQSDFNQNVDYLETQITLNEDNNDLSVLLKSKPGSQIKIQIVQEVDADAAGMVGPEGGIVEVTQNESPLFGVSIEIPQGVVADNTLFTIQLADPTVIPPNPESNVSEVMDISTNKAFDGYLLIKIPINRMVNSEESFLAYYYDEENNQWELMDIIGVNPDGTNITIATTHLTNIFVQTKKIDSYPDKTEMSDFSFNRDRFIPGLLNNRETFDPPGRCSGFAQFSLWYNLKEKINETGIGLSCLYDRKTAIDVIEKAWELSKKYDGMITDLLTNATLIFSDTPTILNLMDSISNKGKAVSLIFFRSDAVSSFPDMFRFPIHNILVFGYKKKLGEIEFYCYNSNYNEVEILKAKKNIWGVYRFEPYDGYSNFITNDLSGKLNDKFKEILKNTSTYPHSNHCEEEEIVTFKFSGRDSYRNIDVEGTLSYDSNANGGLSYDSNGEPFMGYWFRNPALDDVPGPKGFLSIKLTYSNGNNIKTGSDFLVIFVKNGSNGSNDYFYVQADCRYIIGFELTDQEGKALKNDSLPKDFDLKDWDWGTASLRGFDERNGDTIFSARIDSLKKED